MSVLLYAAIIIVVLLVVILWAVLPALKKERLLRFAADRDRLQILQEMASRNDEYISQLRALTEGLETYKKHFKYSEEDLLAARADSVTRSHATVSGKVSEQLASLFPIFTDQFNPRDAHFLGAPVDYVVFKGLDKGTLEEIVLVEIKVGKSQLTTRERQVRDAIQQSRVSWQILRLENGTV